MGGGGGGMTPARARQSLGGFATPKARPPRASNAMDMMPPPPSPGHIGRAVQAHQNQLEDEIRELKRRNAELEEQLRALPSEMESQTERRRLEALQSEVDRLREEADSLRYQLSASQADAADASKLAEELQIQVGGGTNGKDELEGKERELTRLQKEMKLLEERMKGELEAGMEAKRVEVRRMEERAEAAETEGSEMRSLVEGLTQAGQVSTFCLTIGKNAELCRLRFRYTSRNSTISRTRSEVWKTKYETSKRNSVKLEKN
jgi:chromosome segregation ATPase